MSKIILSNQHLAPLLELDTPSIHDVMKSIEDRKIKGTVGDHAATYCKNDKVIYNSLYTEIKKMVSKGGPYHHLLGVYVFPSDFHSGKPPKWAMKDEEPIAPIKNKVAKPNWRDSKVVGNVIVAAEEAGMILDEQTKSGIANSSKKGRMLAASLILQSKDAADRKNHEHAVEIEAIKDQHSSELESLEQKVKRITTMLDRMEEKLENHVGEPA